jgi:hypothetical protein
MASERDFELLDDYIGNRLSNADRDSFEKRIQADPDLQRELRLQQGIVNSLRSARAAELKAMLNNIPPSAIPADTSSFLKWAGVAVAVIAAVGLYFYLKPSDNASVAPVADSVTVTPPSADKTTVVPQADSEESVTPQEEPVQQKPDSRKSEPSTSAPADSSTEAKAPKLNVFDPSEETDSDAGAPAVVSPTETRDGSARTSDILSEIVSDHKNYNFHYQFRDDKLILYGTFDKNLYSILEFFSDNKRTIFLEYKNNFYLLNQAGDKVKPLSPVNDPVLIQKLRQH